MARDDRSSTGGPESIDPVQFCAAQMQALRLSFDALTTEVKRLGNAVDDMRAEQVQAADDGASQAISRLARDSDHGRPYWSAGADHIGRRWVDGFKMRAGGWVLAIVGVMVGAAVVALAVWYIGAVQLSVKEVKP